MKKIIVFSHIPPRDDAADAMLRLELSKDAMVWKFSILTYIRDIILHIQPDIVLLPEIRCQYTRDLAKQLHEWGVTVVQKRCEMGITAETELDEVTTRALFGNWQAGEHIDLDLVWGPRFAEMVAEKTDISEDKIKVVGALGFDQYFIEPPPVEPPDGKTVLFAGGFGYADRQAIYAIPEACQGDDLHVRAVVDDRNRRHGFIKLIAAFKERFPDWKVLIRPHPGEIGTEYTKLLGNDTVFACNSYALVALHQADVVIHTGSTMAIEAHLLDKPTLNYRNTSMDVLVGAVAPTYDEIDGLLDAFTAMDTTKSNADVGVIRDLEDRYYGPMDGKAYIRAAEAIMSLPDKTPSYPDKWPKDEVKYPTTGTYPYASRWRCSACMNEFAGERGRDLLQCPYCGIPCINATLQKEKEHERLSQMQKVPDGVNPPKDNL